MAQNLTSPSPAVDAAKTSPMAKLLQEQPPQIPKMGDLVEGVVLSVSKAEVIVDIEGYTSGVVRGYELYDESGQYGTIKVGDRVQATLLELENENGQMELSFRYAGHKKAWDELDRLWKGGDIVDAIITDANKGGLMVRVGNVEGFLPVSQLTTEHYPRVEGGEKSKILERLQAYVGSAFRVKVIDVSEREGKLIASEKAAYEEQLQTKLAKFNVGDTVEGRVTGVVHFGAFMEFDEGLEGLIHISELAWQRIENPRDIVNVGDRVKAQIISLDRNRISLSMKRLQEDPWKKAVGKYTVNQRVTGTVRKLNPFGAFVELDEEIHGLVHISELADHKVENPAEILKVGEQKEFKIISIDPDQHRLGLSLKRVNEPDQPVATPREEPADTASEPPADAPTPTDDTAPASDTTPMASDAPAAASDAPVEPAAPEVEPKA